MCLILLAWRQHPDYPLIVAANRDEFFARAADPLHLWPDQAMVAGRDRQAGGTWLGLGRPGPSTPGEASGSGGLRFAAITNFREPQPPAAPLSRGHLVSEFLRTEQSIDAFVERHLAQPQAYPGFNLLLGNEEGLFHLSNRHPGLGHPSEPRHLEPQPLPPGVYGLSNHLLDTPWPKLIRARTALSEAIRASEPDVDALWALLRDQTPVADDDLPRTGVDLAWERVLATAFIRLPVYGTRCSTLVMVHRQRGARVLERTWPAPGGSPARGLPTPGLLTPQPAPPQPEQEVRLDLPTWQWPDAKSDVD